MAPRARDDGDARRAALVRSLRALRRLELRLTGRNEPDVWNRYFALEPGARVRYPFSLLLAFDHGTRERAVRDFLLAVWMERLGHDDPFGSSRETDVEFLGYLGLRVDATPEEVRSRFRALVLELHPDLGGNETSARELIERYRASSYGRRGEA